jgi:hypothetical protein
MESLWSLSGEGPDEGYTRSVALSRYLHPVSGATVVVATWGATGDLSFGIQGRIEMMKRASRLTPVLNVPTRVISLLGYCWLCASP